MNPKKINAYLNAGEILSSISAESQNKISNFEIFDSIDSTNTYLLNKTRTNFPSGSVCLTEKQTQGRGRYGRPWVNVEGNIYCSILWRFEQEAVFSGISVAVAVMVLNALYQFGVKKNIQLKWPNDILFNNRKLAGILLESPAKGVVVIGVGLNIQTPVEDVGGIGLDAIFESSPIERNRLIGLMLDEFCQGLSMYSKIGIEYYRSRWDECDFLRGKEVVLLTQPNSIYGIAQGINEQGELIIKDKENRMKTFSYGEVSVRTV